MSKFMLGFGIFMWDARERRTRRYGAIFMAPTTFDETVTVAPVVGWDAVDYLEGRRIHLYAKVLEARPSGHCGDTFFKVAPTQPEIGEEIDLGVGVLYTSMLTYPKDRHLQFELQPQDSRDELWMDPRKLYQLHDQTVELYAEPTEDAFTAAPVFEDALPRGVAVLEDGSGIQASGTRANNVNFSMEFQDLGDGLFMSVPKFTLLD